MLSLAADTSDAPAFAQDAFDPVQQGDPSLYLVRACGRVRRCLIILFPEVGAMRAWSKGSLARSLSETTGLPVILSNRAQELRQSLAASASPEAAAAALPRRWELVPCDPGWFTPEEEEQRARLRARLAAAGLLRDAAPSAS